MATMTRPREVLLDVRTADPALELLRELVAEVRGLREDIRSGVADRPRRSATSLSRDDRALLGRLLPAVGGALGSELFATRELFEHDSAALRMVTRGLSARQVGRLLRRAVGQAVDGYLVQQEGSELHAKLWRVLQVPEFSGNGEVFVPSRRPGTAL